MKKLLPIAALILASCGAVPREKRTETPPKTEQQKAQERQAYIDAFVAIVIQCAPLFIK